MAELYDTMNNSSFRAGFEEFHQRSTHEETFHQFVKDHGNELDLGDVHSCVCLGAGEGDTETLYINSAMPSLRDLDAVEPNRQSFKMLHKNISSISVIDTMDQVSTHFYMQTFEDWKGPPEPVDLIILS